MSKIIKNRAEIPCIAISDYILQMPENPKRLVLLLHGFTENGEVIHKRLADLFGPNDIILAPNGPFPLPEKKEDHYKVGFSWYFYDTFKQEYFIDFKLPSLMLKNLIKELNLEDLPKLIIGYSQGGYLAPFAAAQLNHVDKLIGLACVFRQDLLGKAPSYPIHAIHGNNDPLVDPKRAQDFHGKLLQAGAQGQFIMLENEGHRLTPAFKTSIRELLQC